MLKSSKQGIHNTINHNLKEYINQFLTILDMTIQTHYQKIFYDVYINPKKMKLEQIADRCFISRNTLINDIAMVNRFIANSKKIRKIEEGNY